MSDVAPSMSCRELVELITDYVEGRLPSYDRERFEAHLGLCEACRDYLDQMRTTIQVVGALREDDLDPAMRDQLLDAFRSWGASRPARPGSA